MPAWEPRGWQSPPGPCSVQASQGRDSSEEKSGQLGLHRCPDATGLECQSQMSIGTGKQPWTHTTVSPVCVRVVLSL